MPPTGLDKIAKVVTDLYERTDAATIKVRANDGTYIEMKREEYRRMVREKETPVQDFLTKLDPELERKRQGAWQTLEGRTADRHAQAANSMRDVFSQLLDELAPAGQVKKALWYKRPKSGDPVTRAMRVRWAIGGDSASVSSSTLGQIESLVRVVDATYAKLSAEGHARKGGKDQISRACMNACESVIELIAASRESMEV